MRIALMGSFPIYPFRNKVSFWNDRPDLTTTWNYNLAYALARIPRLEVHFLTMAPLFRTKVLVDQGLHIHFIGHLPKLNLWDRLTDMRYSCMVLKRHLRRLKPDLVHGSGTDHEYAYAAATSGYPNVITVHGVMKGVAKHAPPPKHSVVWKYIKYEPLAIEAATHLIAISPYVEQQFPDFSGKTYPIPNPISPVFFTDRHNRKSKGKEVLFVGKICRRKRVLNLLEALVIVRQSQPDLRLRIVGGVSDHNYRLRLDQFMEEQGLKPRVEFCGPLCQSDVLGLMLESECLVLPSIEETAPMVIAEAMATGLPVIATDVGGIKYMIDDGENGFVIPPDDVTALADSISIILGNGELRERLSVAAKEFAVAYHPGEVARKTAIVYKSIIEEAKLQLGDDVAYRR